VILTRSLRDEQFEQLIVRLLCIMMGAYPVYKNADSPNLQNFENESFILMDFKKFLTLENVAYLAAGYVAGKEIANEFPLWEKPLPRTPGVTDSGCRSGELNVSEMNKRMRDL